MVFSGVEKGAVNRKHFSLINLLLVPSKGIRSKLGGLARNSDHLGILAHQVSLDFAENIGGSEKRSEA